MARLGGKILARGVSFCQSRLSSSSFYYSSYSSRAEGLEEKSVCFWGFTGGAKTAKTLWFEFNVSSNDFKYSWNVDESSDGRLIVECDCGKKEAGTVTLKPFFISKGVTTTTSYVGLGSILYAIGGFDVRYTELEEHFTPKFGYFNFSRPKAGWIEGHTLNFGNRLNPQTVVLDGKIYVLGGIFGKHREYYAEKFGLAEVYDPCLGSWEALPEGPPPQSSLSRVDYKNLYCAALEDEDSKRILVGFYNSNVCYTYDVVKKSWDDFLDGPDMKNIIEYSTCAPIVVGQTLYWLKHFSSKIYAYDLEEKKWFQGCIHGFNDVVWNLRGVPPEYNRPSFLHLGGEQFCLLFSDFYPPCKCVRVHCIKLRVVKCRGSQFLLASLESSQSYNLDPYIEFNGGIVLNGRFEVEPKLEDESALHQEK